jgi:signal transduction histidine kinase
LGYLDLLKQTDLNPVERADFIRRSEAEITRINEIIRQLLDMSRTPGGEPSSTSVHDLCDDLISVFDFQPAANQIDFRADYRAAEDVVWADPDRLRQVFLNIVLNAVDAMEMDGTEAPHIAFGTVNTVIHCRDGQPTEGIRVTIGDNGPGLDPADIPHLFDPFFTTKPPGRGTGLGLSVAIMIVEKMGGRLTAANRENKGAVFYVDLPLAIQGDSDKLP